MSIPLRMGHANYRGTKPLPNWLGYTLFWLIVPAAFVVMVVRELFRREGRVAS